MEKSVCLAAGRERRLVIYANEAAGVAHGWLPSISGNDASVSLPLKQSRYFMDPGVHALQYMDAISGKDLGYRINFYHNLREILNLIPKVRSLLLKPVS